MRSRDGRLGTPRRRSTPQPLYVKPVEQAGYGGYLVLLVRDKLLANKEVVLRHVRAEYVVASGPGRPELAPRSFFPSIATCFSPSNNRRHSRVRTGSGAAPPGIPQTSDARCLGDGDVSLSVRRLKSLATNVGELRSCRRSPHRRRGR